MNEQDLWKALSELDEDLIMKPRKYVSLRMNFLLCILAANVSYFVPHNKPVLSIAVYILSFGVMYGIVTWWINRKRKNKLLIEDEELIHQKDTSQDHGSQPF